MVAGSGFRVPGSVAAAMMGWSSGRRSLGGRAGQYGRRFTQMNADRTGRCHAPEPGDVDTALQRYRGSRPRWNVRLDCSTSRLLHFSTPRIDVTPRLEPCSARRRATRARGRGGPVRRALALGAAVAESGSRAQPGRRARNAACVICANPCRSVSNVGWVGVGSGTETGTGTGAVARGRRVPTVFDGVRSGSAARRSAGSGERADASERSTAGRSGAPGAVEGRVTGRRRSTSPARLRRAAVWPPAW